MELLWGKHEDDDALYFNILMNAKNRYPKSKTFDPESIPIAIDDEKNAEFSICQRGQGNEEFNKRNYEAAIVFYNKALCLAEIGTNNVLFAYGKRLWCYFAMQAYDKCLIDIALALNEPTCTEKKKWRLEVLKAYCIKKSEKSSKLYKMKPIRNAHKNFPFMADFLKIQKNKKFGRHVVTTRDIPVGETIVLEKNFITYTRSNNFIARHDGEMRCITCNRIAPNAVPCLKCTSVMFCNTKCRGESKIHEIDCGSIYYNYDTTDSKYVVQSLLTGIFLFKDFDELRKFVEDAVNAPKTEVPTIVCDERSKYRMFLKLWMPSKMKDFIPATYYYYNIIMRLDAIRGLFDTAPKQLFLMHLVGHHAVVLLHNSINGQLSLFASLLSHSCVPNIRIIWIDNRATCITIRPIKKGEQICIAYMTKELISNPETDLRDAIEEKYGFRCECLKCENNLADLKSIEDVCKFKQLSEEELSPASKDKFEKFIGNSTALLNKYSHLQWSKQMEFISNRLGCCLSVFYNFLVEVK